jgi:D-alanyl-lipoteichoic acid acyltransferase DltB (MBOAT superfamily)
VSFNSWEFPAFFAAVLAVHSLLRGARAQNLFLLAASLLFYASWDWRFLAPLLITGTIDFHVARAMARRSRREDRRPLLMISLCANLGFLAYFKYAGLFVESAAAAASAFGFKIAAPEIRSILPVGMSFYTFHALSYVIDVYRGEIAPAVELEDLLLFLAYFPQLVSGPIARAKSLLPQLARERRTTGEAIDEAAPLVLWGYFKKVVVADRLAALAAAVLGAKAGVSSLDHVLAAAVVAVQIYCDFSGFIDIARGCSKLLGIELQRNFERPFLATNPSEFWRRWNITLSAWMRDYLYIPLGGSREGTARTAFNVAVVMCFSGLWHGAQRHMVVWGLYEAGRLLAWRAAAALFPRLTAPGRAAVWLLRAGTFLSFAFGVIIFRCPSVALAASEIATLGLRSGPHTAEILGTFAFLTWPVCAWELLEEFHGPVVARLAARNVLRPLAYGALLLALSLFSVRDSAPFVYYQF